MAQEDSEEKKVKIRPRILSKDSPEPSGTEEREAGQSESEKLTRWDMVRKNRLKQSGTKFPARKGIRDDNAYFKPEAVHSSGAPAPANQGVARDSVEQGGPSGDDSTAGKRNARRPQPEDEKEVRRKDEYGERWKLKLAWFRRVVFSHRVLTLPAVVVFLIALYFVSSRSHESGVREGVRRAELAATREDVRIPHEIAARINAAVAELRMGNAERALTALQALEGEHGNIASLTYLTALAAMQSGDTQLAERKVQETIAKRERISDALALQAVLETQKRNDPTISTFGDARIRVEEYLRQAIAADAANPFPLIELATLLRYQKRDDEAIALLEAARNRLNPVDSHTVIDVSISLARLQNTPDADLGPAPDGATADSLFTAAYIAMRTGRFDQAVEALRTVRTQMPQDLFDYIVNDPALRRYASEPALAPFYQ